MIPCVFYYYRKNMSGCVHQVAVHEHCSKTVLRPLRFSLNSWCLKSFLFWRLSVSYRSCFFHSCIFHSRIFSAPPANEVDSAWDDQPLTYTQKRKKSLFEPPFRALRGNVRTPSMARWKARGRLYIRRNSTFFAISYGWDVMSGNRSKSVFFEGVGNFERRSQKEGGVADQPLLVSE